MTKLMYIAAKALQRGYKDELARVDRLRFYIAILEDIMRETFEDDTKLSPKVKGLVKRTRKKLRLKGDLK